MHDDKHPFPSTEYIPGPENWLQDVPQPVLSDQPHDNGLNTSDAAPSDSISTGTGIRQRPTHETKD